MKLPPNQRRIFKIGGTLAIYLPPFAVYRLQLQPKDVLVWSEENKVLRLVRLNPLPTATDEKQAQGAQDAQTLKARKNNIRDDSRQRRRKETSTRRPARGDRRKPARQKAGGVHHTADKKTQAGHKAKARKQAPRKASHASQRRRKLLRVKK